VRKFFIIIACLGLLLVLLAAAPASLITRDFLGNPAGFGRHPVEFGIEYLRFWGLYPAVLGALLALAGGLVARLRCLWIPLVAVGAVHIMSFTGFYVYVFRATGLESGPYLLTLTAAAPGLLCVVEGLVLRRTGSRPRTV
jgi:hypothetical protein